MKIYPSFNLAVKAGQQRLVEVGYWVAGDQWQSIDVSKKPEMATREVLNFSFQVAVQNESLRRLRNDIKPNTPWADDHFEERVGGTPLNPGDQWAKWPWGNSADKFRVEQGGKFSHTYMERFWPKHANPDPEHPEHHKGIRYAYGDLSDLVKHLHQHPLSRQAYLPVWFFFY